MSDWLQFADGEILMHVFDISYNQLTGPLPSFLDFTNVPEYAQRGIFISVSLLLPCSGIATSYQPRPCPQDNSTAQAFSVMAPGTSIL